MATIGKDPVFTKGGEIPNDKPIIVELFCGCGEVQWDLKWLVLKLF